MQPERFPQLDESALTDEHRRVREALLAGPRGAMRGPFKALLHSPGLFDTAQSSAPISVSAPALPPDLTELAILVTARHWPAQSEWDMHHRLAMEAGLAPAVAEAIAAGRRPPGMRSEEAAVHDFACLLLRRGEVSDAEFEAVRERFGEAGVADLVGTVGYYSLVSMVLNVDRTQVPGGELPLRPARRWAAKPLP